MAHFYLFACIFFTVYGQLVIKWRINMKNPLPDGIIDKVIYLLKLTFLDPFILSGLAAAFITSLFWMAAMTKLSISYAYPFMSLAFPIVMFGSFFLFGESLSLMKIIGTAIIVVGLIVLSQS